MEKNTINPEDLKETIEKIKNSGNPLLKKIAEAIEKNLNKFNFLNR